MNTRESRSIAIVMAGGFNPKFWPRSTEKNPKPFQHFIGEGTMIQNTINRFANLQARRYFYRIERNS